MIPCSCPQSMLSTSRSRRVAQALPVAPPTIQHPQIVAWVPCPALPFSRYRSINLATMATSPSTTPTIVLAPSTAATLPTALCIHVRSRVRTTHITWIPPIAASAMHRAQSLVAQATALRHGATHDLRNRLQIPVVLTDFCTGRSVGCLILYSGLVFVLREGLAGEG